MNLSQLMTRDPETITADASVLAALDLMLDRGIRHLPVVDRHERLRGIVSLDDLRAALPFPVSLRTAPDPADRLLALDCAVGEVMTHEPLTGRPEMPLGDAAELLARFRIGCLPVVDQEGRVVGIFTEVDALRALVLREPQKRSAADARLLDRELLVAELRAERERIGQQLQRLQDSERGLSAQTREPIDNPERARLLEEIYLEEPLSALAASRLEALDHALARATQGRFGVCEDCGAEIPAARLRAMPGATLCVRCAAGRSARAEALR
ncbi:MAG TPA: CBS domain-containing protein [Myxococcota bacterium]|nr:CBS domain-containing protein [Myxococcota bacterium]